MQKRRQLPTWLRVLVPLALVLVWLAAAGIGGPYFGKISEQSSTDLATFLPKSAEATQVSEQIGAFRNEKTIPLLIVFERNDQKLTAKDKLNLTNVSRQLADVPSVQGASSPPILSEDGKAAYIVLPLQSQDDFKSTFAEIKQQLHDAKLGIDHKLTGPASFAHDLQGAFAGIDGMLLLVALAVVFVILVVVYRSPFLPFIVLATAMTALAIAILIVYHLADAGLVQLNGQVQGILFILVIGATTDYALLYIARYREELLGHRTKWSATKTALKTSFEPIIAAGGTVIAGLMCLLLSDLGSNKALGPVGGIGIGLSIAAALTFLPAVLLVCGRGIFWPRRPAYNPENTEESYSQHHPQWSKIGRFVRRHPRRLWVGITVVLLACCLAVPQLKDSGVPQSELILGYSEAREGQKILNAHFASGSGSPAYVLADAGEQQAVVHVLDSNKGVDSVAITAENVPSGTMPVGEAAARMQQATQGMDGSPQFKDARPKVVDGKILLQVTLADSPDSFAARDTIVALRQSVRQVDNSALVGGTSAAQYDTNQAALRDQRVLIPIILGVITIILMLLLRSIAAPILLLFTTVLSFGATLGVSALLFNHVWGFPGADPSVVIFGFVFLVALGIDYNIFLMTRVREETAKLGVQNGTIKGLVVTGGVVTSAGVVLAATFAALSVIPILFLAQIAFIVAFGVLLDTIVVRSLLVPALTLTLGKRTWWPSRLSKK